MEQTNFINEFRKKYTIITSIVLVIAYLVVLKSSKWVIPHGLKSNPYLVQFTAEGISILFALLLLKVFDKMNIFKMKRGTFFQGIFTGGFLFTISILSLMGNMANMQMNGERFAPISHIIAFVFAMLAIGMSEEFVFRGIIFGSLLEKFPKTRKGVYAAVTVSGLIFGLAHASNMLSGASFEGVFVQMVSAIFLGALLAAIYFRSRNIWVVVFLHAFMDFSALIPSGIFKAGTMVGAISSYSYVKLVSIVIYLIPLLIILRNSKVDEVLKEN